MVRWIAQLRKGLVDFCVLLAAAEEESYVYGLVGRLREMPHLNLTEATVYPAVARLIEERLVRTTERRSPIGPPRRYLSVTAKGKRRLAEMRKHWQGVCKSVGRLMRGV